MDKDLKELLRNVMMAEEYLKKTDKLWSKSVQMYRQWLNKQLKHILNPSSNINFHVKGLMSFMSISVLQQLTNIETPKEEPDNANVP